MLSVEDCFVDCSNQLLYILHIDTTVILSSRHDKEAHVSFRY